MKVIFIFSCSWMFRDVPECSGMFRNVPECSGMFHVPGFIDAPLSIIMAVKLKMFGGEHVTFT